jgi:hypothetical protein
VEVYAQAFWMQKAGNAEPEYEDAFWPSKLLNRQESRSLRFAIADGATETSFSKIWAKQLVQAFCSGDSSPSPWADLLARLPALQRRWLLGVSRRPLPWYVEAKIAAGAFAALLGLQLSVDEVAGNKGGAWDAIAVGDCCLAHIRGETVVNFFPILNSQSFNSRPMLLSSNPAYNGSAAEHLLAIRGRWLSEDAFYLMTDALAAWFLSQVEAGRKPWVILRDLDTNDQLRDFCTLVCDLRADKLLRNDDVTLLRLDVF